MTVRSADEVFLDRIREATEENISDVHFNVDALSDHVGMSPRQLQRKVSALLNYTPNEFIRVIRLKRGKQLLEQRYGSVSEIAYAVGFNNPKYFSRRFQEMFEMAPSDVSTDGATVDPQSGI